MSQKGKLPMLSKWWAPALIAAVLFSSCSPKLAPEGHYQEAPVVADGNTDDWSLPLRFSNESYTLQYNFTNDKKNIYICILSRDEATQLRILRAGMNIYFDPKGEKSKGISIGFPLRKQPEPDSYRNRGGNPIPATSDSRDTRKEQYLLQSDFYNTTGFLHIENGQFAVTDKKSPIQVGMGGMRGGGMGGRRYGSSGNSPGAKEEDNWYQFRLASK